MNRTKLCIRILHWNVGEVTVKLMVNYDVCLQEPTSSQITHVRL